MRALFTALFGLAAAAASGCVQKNASHCANLAGDATCAERGGAPLCSKCTSANDGCVGTVEVECAVGVGGSETTAVGTGSSTTESDSTSGSISMTSVGPSMTTADDTVGSEEEGPKMDIPPPCGNGMLDQGETCDDDVSIVQSCEELGYQSGELGCTEDCELDLTECNGTIPCGDGDLDDGEQCDTDEFAGQTCEGRLGKNYAGDLSCEPGTCEIDDSTCCKVAGVGCLLGTECCSGACGEGLMLLTCAEKK